MVCSTNSFPFRYFWNFVTKATCRHSLSVTEQFLPQLNSFSLAYSTGNNPSGCFCKSMAPMPVSDASACTMNGLLNLGIWSTGALPSMPLRKAISCGFPRSLCWPVSFWGPSVWLSLQYSLVGTSCSILLVPGKIALVSLSLVWVHFVSCPT